MSDQKMIKLTGLWKKETDNGVHYSGGFGYSANILLFQNKYKRSEKDPDLILYVAQKAEKKPEEESTNGPSEIPF